MTEYAFSPLRSRENWRVLKYPLEIADTQHIELPGLASLLSVQFQNGKLMLWAAVDTSRDLQRRLIMIAGTGHWVDLRGLQYVGTAQDPDQAFVWHVFAGATYVQPTLEA